MEKVDVGRGAYALLHILLPRHHGFLPNLEAHLGRLVVHESSEIWGELASLRLALLSPAHLAGVRTSGVV